MEVAGGSSGEIVVTGGETLMTGGETMVAGGSLEEETGCRLDTSSRLLYLIVNITRRMLNIVGRA